MQIFDNIKVALSAFAVVLAVVAVVSIKTSGTSPQQMAQSCPAIISEDETSLAAQACDVCNSKGTLTIGDEHTIKAICGDLSIKTTLLNNLITIVATKGNERVVHQERII